MSKSKTKIVIIGLGHVGLSLTVKFIKDFVQNKINFILHVSVKSNI